MTEVGTLTAKTSVQGHDAIIQGAHILFMDLLAQIVNLVVVEEQELRNLAEDDQNPLEQGSRGSPITVRALKSSIVVLQFGVLEGLANFLSELTVQIDADRIQGTGPSVLTQVEIDGLREQRTVLDARSGDLRVQHSVYQSTLDRLCLVLMLFAKACGRTFRVQRGVAGWNKIVHLKQLRDSLTHIRLDLRPVPFDYRELSPDRIRPSVTISSRDLFAGAEAIVWYMRQMTKICEAVENPVAHKVAQLLTLLEFLCCMQLINLRESCGLTRSQLAKMYPMVAMKPRSDPRAGLSTK